MKPAIPVTERRLAFAAEWYHAEAGIIRPFLITYYVSDKAVEVVSGCCSSVSILIILFTLSSLTSGTSAHFCGERRYRS